MKIYVKSVLFFLIIAGCSCRIVHAAPDELGTECRGAQSTRQMIACGTKLLKEENDRLGITYHKILMQISAPQAQKLYGSSTIVKKIRQHLIASQQSWLAYRHEYCKSVYYMNTGGSDQQIMQIGCELTITKNRIEELKHFLQ
jgi:uncharacterized protein YecT (DUF1311 family)